MSKGFLRIFGWPEMLRLILLSLLYLNVDTIEDNSIKHKYAAVTGIGWEYQ
jgi:hypothetical protein